MSCPEGTLQIGSTAAKYDLDIEQGASFSKTLYLTKSNGFPKDLAGYSGIAQIRDKASATDVIADIGVSFVAPRSSGVIVLSLTKEQTTEFEFYTAVWDMFIESPDGVRSKILKGTVTNNASVTREEEPDNNP